MNCLNNGVCIDKTETTAAYCNCSGIGYNGFNCENDINECLTNNGGCDENADCKNTLGSFSCSCKTGYSGNGTSCAENEKSENNSQAVGIGVGVTFGLLGLVALVLIVLFFLRRKVNFFFI